MINPIKLSPFKHFCITIGNLPTSYVDSLSYYEMLEWLCNYLQNTVIPAVNTNSEAVTELQTLFTELQDYVNDYFENLDVQEEINNKLDEMALNGTLQEIMASYLNTKAVFGFNNVSDMKLAENLIDGSFVKTYGYHTLGDGGSAKYKIREVTNQDTVDEMLLIALSNSSLVAELIFDNEINVKQLGAYGDGVHNDTLAIQKAIDTSNIVYIPGTENSYLVNDNLYLNSDTFIYGTGEKSYIVMPDNLEKTIFVIDSKSNIEIKNIKLSNNTTQSGSSLNTSKNKLMYIYNSNNINIHNCIFTKAYSRGIIVHKSKDIYYKQNIFTHASYDMLMIYEESENIYVDECIFDTIDSTSNVAYLFATGTEDRVNTHDFSTKNVYVTNSKFLNNTLWEGIDTHGCIGFYCLNNYIKNCKTGIMAQHDNTILTNETIKHDNIYIENNVVEGGSTSSNFGIVAGSNTNDSFFSENVVIKNNRINNFPNVSNSTTGSITIKMTKNAQIIDNIVINSASPTIYSECSLYTNIINNKLETTSNICIHLGGGTTQITIKNNRITNNNTGTSYAIYGTTLHIVNLENNHIIATNYYNIKGTNTSGVTNQYTTEMGKIGNYIINNYGIIKYYCTDTVIKAKSAASVTQVSLAGNANTKLLTGTNAIYYLTEDEEITIPGANTGGTDLTTKIVKFISRDKFEIADNIEENVTNVNPVTSASTWVAV